MLALARARTADPRVRYVQGFAEDLSLRRGCADLVVSSLAFHYVADLGLLLDRIAAGCGGPAGWWRRWTPAGTAELAQRDDPVRPAATPPKAAGPGLVRRRPCQYHRRV